MNTRELLFNLKTETLTGLHNAYQCWGRRYKVHISSCVCYSCSDITYFQLSICDLWFCGIAPVKQLGLNKGNALPVLVPLRSYNQLALLHSLCSVGLLCLCCASPYKHVVESQSCAADTVTALNRQSVGETRLSHFVNMLRVRPASC